MRTQRTVPIAPLMWKGQPLQPLPRPNRAREIRAAPTRCAAGHATLDVTMWVVACFALLLAATIEAAPLPGPRRRGARLFQRRGAPPLSPGKAAGGARRDRGCPRRVLPRVVLIDNRAAGLMRRISELTRRQGQIGRSLEFAERSLEIEPGNPEGLWLQGAALFNLGRPQDRSWHSRRRSKGTPIDAGLLTHARPRRRALRPYRPGGSAYSRAVEFDEEDSESLVPARRRTRRGAGDSPRRIGRSRARPSSTRSVPGSSSCAAGWRRIGSKRGRNGSLPPPSRDPCRRPGHAPAADRAARGAEALRRGLPRGGEPVAHGVPATWRRARSRSTSRRARSGARPCRDRPARGTVAGRSRPARAA